jgi:hypothetical protein
MVIRHEKPKDANDPIKTDRAAVNPHSDPVSAHIHHAEELDDEYIAQIAKSLVDLNQQNEDMVPEGYEGTLTFEDEHGRKQTLPTADLGHVETDKHNRGKVLIAIGGVVVGVTITALASRKAWRMRQKPR